MSELPVGTPLRHYVLREVLGAGGFGITYRAEHEKLSARQYAIKEYFPSSMARRVGLDVVADIGFADTFEHYRQKCLLEAEVLSFCPHSSIVEVIDFFEENNTAYTVLNYVSGKTFGQWLDDLDRMPTQEELDLFIEPLLSALELVHSKDLLHRDIAPDNIIIRSDGTPCLIDFGAARHMLPDEKAVSHLIVKQGYSPPEQYQYDANAMGPWSDIYALAATLYRALTSSAPPDSISRSAGTKLPDLVVKLSGKPYREGFLKAIAAGLAEDYKQRPSSIGEWRDQLFKQPQNARSSVEVVTLPDAPEMPAGNQRSEPSANGAGRTEQRFEKRLLFGTFLALVGMTLLVYAAFWEPNDGKKVVEAPPATGDLVQKKNPEKQKAENEASGDGSVSPKQTPSHIEANQKSPGTASEEQEAKSSEDLSKLLEQCHGKDGKAVISKCKAALASPLIDNKTAVAVHERLARTFRASGKLDAAIASLGDAIGLAPKATSFSDRGILRLQQGDPVSAVRDFEAALRLEPDSGLYNNNLAWARLKAGSPDTALAPADNAIRLSGDKAYVWDTRGHIHESLGKLDLAIKDYKKAIALDPKHKSSVQALKRLLR